MKNLKCVWIWVPWILKFAFKNSWKPVWRLELWNTPILIFDSESNQKIHFLCESVAFDVDEDGFKEIVLLEANKTYQK